MLDNRCRFLCACGACSAEEKAEEAEEADGDDNAAPRGECQGNKPNVRASNTACVRELTANFL